MTFLPVACLMSIGTGTRRVPRIDLDHGGYRMIISSSSHRVFFSHIFVVVLLLTSRTRIITESDLVFDRYSTGTCTSRNC